MRLAVALGWLFLLGAGCDPGEPADAGMDAATDAGAPAGEPCDDHAACVESAAAAGHDRVHCIEGRCRARCGATPECADHPRGPMCVSGTCGCVGDAECPGFPAFCAGNRCGECRGEADCVFRRTNRCGATGRCVRCLTASDCPSGSACEGETCVGPDDQDGDGFGADDCDDADPRRFPGALPICGNGAREGCPGTWDALAQQLGVAEAGQRRLRAVLPTPAEGTQLPSVSVASVPTETLVAVVFRAAPQAGVVASRVARLFAVPVEAPTEEIAVPLTDLSCGLGAPVTLEEVEAVSISAAADGTAELAVAATVDGPAFLAHYLARYSVDGRVARLESCARSAEMASFGYVGVAVAPDTGETAGLLRGPTGSRDNVLHRVGADDVTLFRSRDWIDGQGAVLVARSRPTAGGPVSLHFAAAGGLVEQTVASVASSFDAGRAALAAAPGGEYAIALPTAAGTFLVEGRCDAGSCAPVATPTTWDLAVEDLPTARWVSSDRYALAFVRYTQTGPGTNEAAVRLRGFTRLARPVPADLGVDAPVVADRRSAPGVGALIVRDLDVSSTADRVDVAMIAQSGGGPPELLLRRVELCASE